SGLAMSGGVLATLLSQQAASACVPPSVASETIQAASYFAAGEAGAGGGISPTAGALAEGSVKGLVVRKIQIRGAVLLVLTFFGAGATVLTQHVLADRPVNEALQAQPKEPPRPAAKDPQALAQPNTTKKEAEPIPTLVSGVVKSVDAERKTLTVS